MRSADPRTMTRYEAEDEVARGWRSRDTCCPDAEINYCVCRHSVKCPRHGIICVGSHD